MLGCAKVLAQTDSAVVDALVPGAEDGPTPPEQIADVINTAASESADTTAQEVNNSENADSGNSENADSAAPAATSGVAHANATDSARASSSNTPTTSPDTRPQDDSTHAECTVGTAATAALVAVGRTQPDGGSAHEAAPPTPIAEQAVVDTATVSAEESAATHEIADEGKIADAKDSTATEQSVEPQDGGGEDATDEINAADATEITPPSCDGMVDMCENADASDAADVSARVDGVVDSTSDEAEAVCRGENVLLDITEVNGATAGNSADS